MIVIIVTIRGIGIVHTFFMRERFFIIDKLFFLK
jgi:hypothetical protein